jgi:hypothetical protein
MLIGDSGREDIRFTCESRMLTEAPYFGLIGGSRHPPDLLGPRLPAVLGAFGRETWRLSTRFSLLIVFGIRRGCVPILLHLVSPFIEAHPLFPGDVLQLHVDFGVVNRHNLDFLGSAFKTKFLIVGARLLGIISQILVV